MKGLRCTVLGANGFIGTNLCLALASRGAIVKGCGRSVAARPELIGKIDWLQFDLTKNNESIQQVIQGADFVVHLVSTLLPVHSNREQIRDLEENLIGTVRLLQQCKDAGVKKVIFASSGGTVYGPQQNMPINETTLLNPISSYGIVKGAIENYLHLYRRLYGLDFVALRISNPFGPFQMPHDQGLIAALMGKTLNGSPVEIWGDGTVVRDYIYIDDVVNAIILAMALDNSDAPRVYNIASGVGRSVNEVLHAIGAAHGKLTKVNYHPARAVDVPTNILDVCLARTHLGWTPTTEWNDALEKTYVWLRNVTGNFWNN
jgi:UDP-glucose 4-epimerase